VIRRILKVALGLVALSMLYVLVTFVQVWMAAGTDDRTTSSAIIVLGAAQYDGKPSPVLKARLDHAADLYEAGAAKVIIVTGGKQRGDRVGEGRAGYDYLRGKGIPESALKVEVDGTDTYEELSAAVHILDTAKLGRSAIVVSSPYHAFRADAIAEEVGLTPHFSAASDGSSTSSLLRETGGVALGRIISYRRLSNLD
jgi:uncharacterized SAM-binding protein YcdF (DUF218 family)